ncbi:NF-X1-type zinc finger protein NFXL1 [Platanthera guangdongensis]|uniref:NF-X1-type zinc finger protein NFXL1 n=1 Tax=Platanthera guangdongensis TaxID=2320717 RepID=A0ABR2M698_9ASPA
MRPPKAGKIFVIGNKDIEKLAYFEQIYRTREIDADIRALVLRFGENCVLVWSNDKNFMTFLSDHATVTRLINHSSTSSGTVMVVEALAMSAQA